MAGAKRKIHRNGQLKQAKRAFPLEKVPSGADAAFGKRRLELLRLERRLFPKAGQEKRVERALKAVREFRGSFASKVDLDTVKWIAQDPDILDI
jgi:hypothetical protein